MQTDLTRRHEDGSIDHDFYRKQAARMRARTMTQLLGGTRIGVVAGVVLALLVTVGLVRMLNGIPPTAATEGTARLAVHAR